MQNPIAHYGLRVMADYSLVVFPAGEVRFTGAGTWDGRRLTLAGEGKMEVKGKVAIAVTGYGRLHVALFGTVDVPIGTFVAPGESTDISFAYSGNDVVRLVHTVTLGRGASYRERVMANVSGLFDVSTTVTHEAAATSELVTKVAVAEDGMAIARGKIVIGKGAEGSRASERIDALLLGPRAEADVLPTLAVDTGDVACKHAASVGHLDANVLFYLGSRGLGPGEAQRVLVDAFLL